MRKFIYLFSAILLGFSTFACGSDSNDEPDQPQNVTLTTRSCTYGDNKALSGAEIDAKTVNQITVSYSSTVTVNSSVAITLNGTAVSASVSPLTSMSIIIPVTLQSGTNYTLTIPEGAVVRSDNAKVSAAAYSVSFSTIKDTSADPSAVAKSLINPNATQEAKNVYNFLLENYGKKQLSGAMGGVAWELTFCDYIKKESGYFPAIAGFDYIHLAWSPDNWINYGDITPVKTAWDMNCIPAMTWHWNVSAKEGSDIKKDGTCSPDKTDFQPKNVLVDGTWENKTWNDDVKKLAGYLKLLQDAGIPVIWRPFHEAAGDFTWGAWFWWGKDGVDVTKKLWVKLHDELTNTYGLNNLIWVWTMSTSDQGKLASIDKVRNSYPGNDYADMVGADLYPDKVYSDQSAQFNLINSVVEGKKMIALSEVGNLVSVEKAVETNTLWSYFMCWYDYDGKDYYFKEWNNATVWKTVMEDSHVINQEDMPSLK